MEERYRSKESERHNATLMASLRILDRLEQVEALSLADLSRDLGLNKSRVMRLCGTLEAMGYLIFRALDRTYSLGPRVLSLGRAFERYTPLMGIIRSALRHLAEELGESVSFQVIRGDRRLCLCAIEQSNLTRYTTPEGGEASFPYGASGKVLLAWGPADLLEAVLARAPYPRYAAGTILTAQELRSAIERTRREGFSLSVAERTADTAALSVPVFDRDGHLRGAISLATTSEAMTPYVIRKALPKIQQTAMDLRTMAGSQGDFVPRQPRPDKE